MAFDGRSTADDVLAGVDLSGRVAVVTGANAGIGFEAARALAGRGAEVHLACRDRVKGERARDRVLERHPGARVQLGQLDLASLASVRDYARGFGPPRVDILLCNAGLITWGYKETRDGFERVVGVSHIGHVELFSGLRERLARAGRSRLVMVSSQSHRSPRTLDFSRFPFPRQKYRSLLAYGQAKLCNALFAAEVQRRYSDLGITAASLHPGSMIPTEISRGSRLTRIVFALVTPFTKSVAQGAATSVYCTTAPEVEENAGGYFADCAPKKPSREAQDPAVARRLWDVTRELIDAASMREGDRGPSSPW